MARRPTTDYIVFATIMREKIQKENPEATFYQIGRLVAEKWQSTKEAHRMQCDSAIQIPNCFFCSIEEHRLTYTRSLPQARAQSHQRAFQIQQQLRAKAQQRAFQRQQQQQQQNSIAALQGYDNDDNNLCRHDVAIVDAGAGGGGGEVSDENNFQDRIAVGLVEAGGGGGEKEKEMKAAEVGGAKEQDEEEEQKRCKICFGAEQTIVFVPCGHLCTCEPCANKVKICPICRKGITMRVPVFYS